MTDLGLKRVLRLPAVSFIAIGFMIGGGVFVFTGIVLKIAGRGLPVAYALAVIPVFISMLPLAMLGSAMPTTGANYKYPCRMVSPALAFVGLWVYILASFWGQIPLYALSCAKYAGVFIPGVSLKLIAVIILTILYIINILGVRLAAQVQGTLVIILISALLLYSGKGLSTLQPGFCTGIFDAGAGNLLLGTALLTFTYFGANGIIELGGEIINPGRVIPRSYFIAFPVVAVVYVLVALSTVNALSLEQLTSVDEPLIHTAGAVMGKFGAGFFIAGGAVLALVTTLNALFLVGTKSLLIMVEDDLLPKFFGRLNNRFRTPHVLLTAIWVLSIAGMFSGLSLETFASYAALGGLIIFLPIQIASLRLPDLFPERYENSEFRLTGFWLWFCPIVGILMVLFFGLVIIVDLKSPLKIGWFSLFIVSGILFYYLRRAQLLKRGINLDNLKNKEDWGDE